MKRKHSGYMNPLIRFWNWYLQKKVQSGTTAPRDQGLRGCRASVTQWGLVDGYLSSTLVPLLSRATADQPVAAKCTGALHPTVLQFSWGWLSSPTYSMLPCTHVLSCAHVLSSPLPTDHLPARAHISTYEAPKPDRGRLQVRLAAGGQIGGLRIAFVFAQLSRIWVMMKVGGDPPPGVLGSIIVNRV